MYIRAAILTILLVFSLATVALSQPPSDKGRNERSEWETELQRVKRDKPKAYEFMKRASYLATQRLLGRLGYGVGPYNGVLDEKTKMPCENIRGNGIYPLQETHYHLRPLSKLIKT